MSKIKEKLCNNVYLKKILSVKIKYFEYEFCSIFLIRLEILQREVRMLTYCVVVGFVVVVFLILSCNHK